jgi:transposase
MYAINSRRLMSFPKPKDDTLTSAEAVVQLKVWGAASRATRRAVWVFLHAEGLSFKKTVRPAEQMRPDIARKRTRWKAPSGSG